MIRVAVAALLMFPVALGFSAEQRPGQMEPAALCAEHGRHVRAKRDKPTERQRVIAAWAKDYGFRQGDEHAVLTKEPRLGMSRCTAIAAYGRPSDVNRTTTASGVREQWVYDRRGRFYLYFTDDRLDAVQD